MQLNALAILLPPIFVVAGYTEIKRRRIPNWLTVSGMVCGLAGAFIIGDLAGLKSSALGLLIGGGVFFPFCLMGVLGGGDLKLMAAVGAIVGVEDHAIWRVLYYTCFAGGALALVMLIWSGQLLAGLNRTLLLLIGRREQRKEAGGLRKVTTLPYGIAIAIGTAWAFWARGC